MDSLNKHLEECFLKNNKWEIDKLLNDNNIRIPIIKIIYNYEDKTKLSLDLAVNNILGFCKSHLLHSYSLIDERCKKLGILIKVKKQIFKKKKKMSYLYLIFFLDLG